MLSSAAPKLTASFKGGRIVTTFQWILVIEVGVLAFFVIWDHIR